MNTPLPGFGDPDRFTPRLGQPEIERLPGVLQRPFDDLSEPGVADPADTSFPPDWAQSIEVSCSS